eukprot:gnl/TRDRNA2_/TRDRNA2_186875_c0_seq1.p1 gnl/TRDRNA2_/TRDRNA2_186875_c0~~gnl/TRDRNA2_/TRDRNA2_186875_c0_seq1.p1  ORF type:complete len:337 (+),score=67.40 gnl/TRDRNA2_/TRDRNA2_186875_c0_seq1:70-1011(+)
MCRDKVMGGDEVWEQESDSGSGSDVDSDAGVGGPVAPARRDMGMLKSRQKTGRSISRTRRSTSKSKLSSASGRRPPVMPKVPLLRSGPEADFAMRTKEAWKPLPPRPENKQAAVDTPQRAPAERRPEPPSLSVAPQKPQLPEGASCSEGMAARLANLRRDNERLRQALVAAQREAEKAIMEREAAEAQGTAADTGNSVDMAHLLSLVKAFGDGLGGGEEDGVVEFYDDDAEPSAGDQATAFSLATPRGADDTNAVKRGMLQGQDAFSLCTPRAADRPAKDDEVAQLRDELNAAHQEIARLRREMAAREREVWL